VEPMLLIPFIENSFKHGTGMIEAPFIDITLKVSKQQLFFQVTNRFAPGDQSKDKNSGIGLANVKTRLQLLYPGKYDLVILNDDNIFSVQLKLNLA
jgi:two-component system, LytTR family, sensor kinase